MTITDMSEEEFWSEYDLIESRSIQRGQVCALLNKQQAEDDAKLKLMDEQQDAIARNFTQNTQGEG